MPVSKLDENSRPSAICVSQNDGVTIVPLTANPISHGLSMSTAMSVDNGNNNGNAMIDENEIPVFMALSSAEDGTLVEVYADPVTGALLVQS